MVYETCGFLGLGKKQMDLSSVCDIGTEFRDGKCVSTVDVTSDNASMCDTPGVAFRDGKCVSTIDVTSDNASMCDTPGVEFRDGKCVSTVDVTSDNASMCDTPGVAFRDGKCHIKYSTPHIVRHSGMPGNHGKYVDTMSYVISKTGGVPSRLEYESFCKPRPHVNEKAQVHVNEKAQMHVNEKAQVHVNEKAQMHVNEKAQMHVNEKAQMHVNEKAQMHVNENAYIRNLQPYDVRGSCNGVAGKADAESTCRNMRECIGVGMQSNGCWHHLKTGTQLDDNSYYRIISRI